MCKTIPYKKICKVLKQETPISFLIYHFDKFQNHEELKQEWYEYYVHTMPPLKGYSKTWWDVEPEQLGVFLKPRSYT